MIRNISVFVDSDVVISSMISKKGAAFLVMKHEHVQRWISLSSQKELRIVAKRLKLRSVDLELLLITSLKIVPDNPTHLGYTNDKGDTHIVSGAVAAKVTFLITYNIRHFNIEKIKRDLDILVMTPGQFLQYLRSKE